MIQGIIKFLLSGFAVYATAYILSGVTLSSFSTALIVCVVLAILNVLIRPILIILSLPINILTLGLFTFIINAFIVILASKIVPGFKIDSFGTAILFSIVLSLINFVLHSLIS